MDKELLREKGMQRLKNLAEHLDQKQKKKSKLLPYFFILSYGKKQKQLLWCAHSHLNLTPNRLWTKHCKKEKSRGS
ncbi:hypothetical protein GCM10025857_55150 [Alicyclobacillus contaminans]|nr:hypothetical protein GCM10025857_55150 [Alicyclobacillus contaminans]